MRIHHLNCATLCPCAGAFMAPRAPGLSLGAHWRARHALVCHCLLIESRVGLILVDSGLGTRDLAQPQSLGRLFLGSIRPQFDPAQTALAHIQALGFTARDVRHVVLTHLDLDHAGGIADFPAAQVHVSDAEYQAAMEPHWRERLRYLPAQWAHQPLWQRHGAGGEDWFGFAAVRAVPGLADELLLVPLPGHTRGHCAVAVRQDAAGQPPWLLHCGDAYFFRGEMQQPARCPPGLRVFQRLVETGHAQRLANQARLRALAHAPGQPVRLFCAHDPLELAQLGEATPPR